MSGMCVKDLPVRIKLRADIKKSLTRGERVTKEDLMQVYYIDKEIALWKEELERLEKSSYASGTGFSRVAKTGRISDRVAEIALKKAETEEKIRKKIIELEKVRSEVTDYILDIEDCQTRLIFKLRCLNLMSWNEVADRVGGMNSENSVKKRFYRYLDKCS